MAAWALGEILDPATAPALRAAFAKEKDDEVRRALFRALAFLGERVTELARARALDAKDPELRSRAVQMLGGLDPGIWPWPWPWPQPRPMPLVRSDHRGRIHGPFAPPPSAREC